MPGNKSLLIFTVSSPQEFVQAALQITLWTACRVVTIPHHPLMYFLLPWNSSGNRNCLLPSSKGLEPSFGLEAHGGGMRTAPFLPCCHKHKQLWGAFLDWSKYPKAFRHSSICFHLLRYFPIVAVILDIFLLVSIHLQFRSHRWLFIVDTSFFFFFHLNHHLMIVMCPSEWSLWESFTLSNSFIKIVFCII